MKLIIAAALLFCVLDTVMAAPDVIKGVIGDTELSYKVRSIASGSAISLPKNIGSRLLRVKEVYPDTPKQPTYTYDLLINGRLIYRRDYTGTGFGPVSYFVRVPAWASPKRSITLVNRGKEPVRIQEIVPVDEKKLSAFEKGDSFGLLGLVTPYHGPEEAQKWLMQIVEKLPVKEGFYKGYSTEIPYAAHTPEQVAEAIDRQLQWAKQHNLAFLPSFVSWWGGTPMRIPDGEGGKFGDIKYQQVCWSPEDESDDNPQLKELLGNRWNVHYGLSVPNHWSNTPWLTMNSPVLNAYRKQRLEQAVGLLTERIIKSSVTVPGIYLENEPRYWDTACEAGNPKSSRKTVWADFNPLVIADAAKDGVNLDPSDGLDDSERLWLVRNVARYNQKIVDWTNDALMKSKLSSKPDVYTHSLQLDGFPGDTICHPMSEFAYAKGAYTGLEGLWTKLSDFDRIREWGPWANVNREENDGQAIEYHLWDLRVTYARGGKLYNSYNWHNIGSDRFFAYVKQFIDNLPVAMVKNPELKQQGPRLMSFRTDPDVQGVNTVKLNASLTSSLPSAILAIVRNSQGRIIGFSRVEGPFKEGTVDVDFTFAEPFELIRGERGTLSVEAEKAELTPGITIKQAAFGFDLRRERNQSLFVTAGK